MLETREEQTDLTKQTKGVKWNPEVEQQEYSPSQTMDAGFPGKIDNRSTTNGTTDSSSIGTNIDGNDDDDEDKKPSSFMRHASFDTSKSHDKKEENASKDILHLEKLTAIFGQNFVFTITSLAVVVTWSAVCVHFAEIARDVAMENPDGTADRWLDYIESTNTALSVLGTLFTFSLVFRFNACYERWWEGRIFWGQIISATLDIATMNRAWVRNDEYADRISRFIVAYAYAVKAQLRGRSLTEEPEEGPALVERGILTADELLDMEEHPCWQPQYCTDMIREIILELHNDESCLALANDHKAYGQLFRCFDNVIVKLNHLVGETVRVRAAGLPKAYDVIHLFVFYVYFFLADIVWSVSMGWALPIFIGFSAAIILFLIVMGSGLVDPFGDDIVDLPLERFCATIEGQIFEIDARSRRGTLRTFAQSSNASYNPLKRHASKRKRMEVSFKIGNLH